jgi:hypothetical protein
MSNYKLIGWDNVEYGPATLDEVCRWISEGRLNVDSLAKAEEDESWRPLSTFEEFEEPLRAQARIYGRNEVTAGPPPVKIGQPGAEGGSLNVASCLGRSSQLLGANFGLLVGATTLMWLLGLTAQLLPFIGGMVYVLLEGVLYGGLFLVYIRSIRGEPVGVGTIFQVYGPGMSHLVLVGLLTSLLTSLGFLLFIIPGVYLLVAWAFAIPLVVDRRLEFWRAMELSRKVTTRMWFQVALLLLFAFLPVVVMYVYAQVKIFMVAYPGFQELVRSGTPDMQQLTALMTEVAKVGVPLALLNKIVLLFNLPFAAGALMYAYEDLFGRAEQRPPD